MPEGMGHALEIVRRLLRTGGRLIDLHPVSGSDTVEVRVGERRHLVGSIQEDAAGAVRYSEADAALTRLVEEQEFGLLQVRTFTFRWHLDSLEDLDEWLAERSHKLPLPATSRARLVDLLASSVTSSLDSPSIILTATIRAAAFRLR